MYLLTIKYKRLIFYYRLHCAINNKKAYAFSYILFLFFF